MKKSWYILCPKKHRVTAPSGAVHDTPDGILVEMRCTECYFEPFLFTATSHTTWTRDDVEEPHA